MGRAGNVGDVHLAIRTPKATTDALANPTVTFSLEDVQRIVAEGIAQAGKQACRQERSI
jgi:hypothetical protein